MEKNTYTITELDNIFENGFHLPSSVIVKRLERIEKLEEKIKYANRLLSKIGTSGCIDIPLIHSIFEYNKKLTNSDTPNQP